MCYYILHDLIMNLQSSELSIVRINENDVDLYK